MIIGRILLFFYCLTIEDAVCLLLLAAAGFCLVADKLDTYKWWRWMVAVFLMALLAVILYTTVGSRSENLTEAPQLVPFHSYRAVRDGANPELYRSNFMNAALFFPAGLLGTALLPRKWYGWCRCVLVTVLLCAVSTLIEYLQYRYALGLCEIDDVIHNAAGALAGSLAALLIPQALDKVRKVIHAVLQTET